MHACMQILILYIYPHAQTVSDTAKQITSSRRSYDAVCLIHLSHLNELCCSTGYFLSVVMYTRVWSTLKTVKHSALIIVGTGTTRYFVHRRVLMTIQAELSSTTPSSRGDHTTETTRRPKINSSTRSRLLRRHLCPSRAPSTTHLTHLRAQSRRPHAGSRLLCLSLWLCPSLVLFWGV